MKSTYYLTVRAAAASSGLCEQRIRALAAAGRLGALKHGSVWMISTAALSALQTHGPGGRPAVPKNNPKKSTRTA